MPFCIGLVLVESCSGSFCPDGCCVSGWVGGGWWWGEPVRLDVSGRETCLDTGLLVLSGEDLDVCWLWWSSLVPELKEDGSATFVSGFNVFAFCA